MPTLTPLEMGLAIALVLVIAFLLYSKFVAKVSPKTEIDTLLHKVHPTQTVATVSSPPGAVPVTVTIGATPVAAAAVPAAAPAAAEAPSTSLKSSVERVFHVGSPAARPLPPAPVRGAAAPAPTSIPAAVAAATQTAALAPAALAPASSSQSIASPTGVVVMPPTTAEVTARTALMFATEGPIGAKYILGVTDDANPGTYLIQPAHPEVPDAWQRYWTTMTALWPLHPEWGTGNASWELAYQAAIVVVGPATGSPRVSLPLPTTAPDLAIVTDYLQQPTIQEKAKFYSDNAAVLGRYQFNLDSSAQVLYLLSQDTGALMEAQYQAATNQYIMPDSRTLGAWSLAELGLNY